MAMISFMMLTGGLLVLTVWGGGLFIASVGLAAVLLGLAALAAIPRPLGARVPAPPAAPVPIFECALGAVLLFVLFMTIPLPPAATPFIGAGRAAQNQAVVAALRDAAQQGLPVSTDPWFSLTRSRAGTLRFFLLLAAAFSAALTTAAFTPRLKAAFLRMAALIGLAVGVAGYVGQRVIPQGDTLWWFIPIPRVSPGPVGCFINRNHFGGFVAVLAAVAFALAAHALIRRRWLPAVGHGGVAAVMGGVVILSLSRGALLALGAGVVMILAVLALRRHIAWAVALAALAALAALLVFARAPEVRQRLEGLDDPRSIPSVQNRLMEWREALRAWPAYPVLGAGANALRMVYPQHRLTSSSRWLVHAENEYVQLWVEGGLAGTALAGVLLAAFLHRRRAAAGAGRAGVRGDTEAPAELTLALAGALTVVAVHGALDFPLRLPLHAVMVAALAGLALPPPPALTGRRRRLAQMPAALGVIGALLLTARGAEELRTLDDPEALRTAPYRVLERAIVRAPTSWHAWYYFGRALYMEGAGRHDRAPCLLAERFITRAAQLDPNNYRLWVQLGETRRALQDDCGARAAFAEARRLRPWLSPPPIPEAP
jgi:hypothetical protein